MNTFSNVPDMLVIFRGEIDRELEGHVVEAMQNQTPDKRPVDYKYHEATSGRPEERIYFFHPNPQLTGQAKHIGDMPGYNGLSTRFEEKAMGIHMPSAGGPYLATQQLVIEAPIPPKV